MQEIQVIAFTHKTIGVDDIGRYHLSDDVRAARLQGLKAACGLSELMYLSTCNRVEFVFVRDEHTDSEFLAQFFGCFLNTDSPELIAEAVETGAVYRGQDALEHIFRVASSLDSLVVGEREIITQVRNAFEESAAMGLTGDIIRLVIKKTIETAKAVYTETAIARNPVSVVSLAYRKLRALNVQLDARILIVGSGVTNTAMARYLRKHGFTRFSIFNRTQANAEKLALEIGGNAYPLTALDTFAGGFEVIVTCTGADHAVITPAIYRQLAQGDRTRKVVIDLAVPNDLDPEILNAWDVNLIAVNNLQEVAQENLKEREKELDRCNAIIGASAEAFRTELKTRRIELAMRHVPSKVKEIRDTAVNSVFAREIEQLDPASRELLDRVLGYVEKKYISVPMKMAREILTAEAARS
ncbi:MAG: glutamyl-tRNA reductase [Bacteroidetes bacterium]|nr:glutamyl-tRNA reductase [Bacteroidota bacterium]